MIYISFFITLICLIYTSFEVYKFKGYSFLKKNNYSNFFDSILLTNIFIIIFKPSLNLNSEDLETINNTLLYSSLLILFFNLNKIYNLYSCIKITNKIDLENNSIEKFYKDMLLNLFKFNNKTKIIKSKKTLNSNDYIKYSNKDYIIFTNIFYNNNNKFFTINEQYKNKIFNLGDIHKIFKLVEYKNLNILLLVDKKNNKIITLNEKDFNLLNYSNLENINKNSIALLNIIIF